jgi:hypothetical protein
VSWPVTEAWSVPALLRVGSDCLLRLALPCTVMVGIRLLSATRIEVEATSKSKLAAMTAGCSRKARPVASSRLRGSRRSTVSAGRSRVGALPITWV